MKTHSSLCLRDGRVYLYVYVSAAQPSFWRTAYRMSAPPVCHFYVIILRHFLVIVLLINVNEVLKSDKSAL